MSATLVQVIRDGTVTFMDATGTPVELDVNYENGDFAISEPQDAAPVLVYDRNVLVNVRKGQQQQPTITLSKHTVKFTDGVTADTVNDFIRGRGAYSGNISTGMAAGDPCVTQYAVDIKFTADNTAEGGGISTKIARKCVWNNEDFAEGDPSSTSWSFTCYGGVEDG